MVFNIMYEPWEWGCWGGDKEDELTHNGHSLSNLLILEIAIDCCFTLQF